LVFVEFKMNDAEIIERFEAATLTGDQFPHREHIRVAWLYLRDRPLLDVLDSYPRRLRALASALGADGLYHETITWFFLLLVYDRIARSAPDGDWETFARKNADLLLPSREILSRHYTPETWQSELAKRRFLLPDAPVRDAGHDAMVGIAPDSEITLADNEPPR
jgi:hypothetical protein